MATIRQRLQREIFDITEEKLVDILHVTKLGKKKKKISFLCATKNKEKPVYAHIHQVKETDKDTFKKKVTWPLLELQVVDGKDENKETPELDLGFDRVYKWVGSSVPEKYAFIKVLWKLCCLYLPKQKPQFVNIPSDIIKEDILLNEGKLVIAPGENLQFPLLSSEPVLGYGRCMANNDSEEDSTVSSSHSVNSSFSKTLKRETVVDRLFKSSTVSNSSLDDNYGGDVKCQLVCDSSCDSSSSIIVEDVRLENKEQSCSAKNSVIFEGIFFKNKEQSCSAKNSVIFESIFFKNKEQSCSAKNSGIFEDIFPETFEFSDEDEQSCENGVVDSEDAISNEVIIQSGCDTFSDAEDNLDEFTQANGLEIFEYWDEVEQNCDNEAVDVDVAILNEPSKDDAEAILDEIAQANEELGDGWDESVDENDPVVLNVGSIWDYDPAVHGNIFEIHEEDIHDAALMHDLQLHDFYDDLYDLYDDYDAYFDPDDDFDVDEDIGFDGIPYWQPNNIGSRRTG